MEGLFSVRGELVEPQAIYAAHKQNWYKTVAERLGHSTVVITLDTYSHVTPGVKEDAANRFEEALRQAGIPAGETVG